MTDSPDRFPWEHDDSLLGPAVPQKDAAPADDALPEPLSPFMGGETPISTDAHPAFASEDEPAADAEDIPWLEDLQPEPTTAAFDGPPTMPAEPESELPTMDAFLVSADDESMSVGPASGFDTPFPGGGELSSPFGAEAEVGAGAMQGDAGGSETAAAPTGADGLARTAGDVADRLERIAGVLRSGDPSRLLAGASDPLEMLVLGYVLGCSNSGRADR